MYCKLSQQMLITFRNVTLMISKCWRRVLVKIARSKTWNHIWRSRFIVSRTFSFIIILTLHQSIFLLLETHNYIGDPIIKEHCPFSDRYRLTYNTDDGFEDKIECSSSSDLNTEVSELDSCPSGSQMNLRFKGCSFEDHDIKFDCLGHWTGNDNQKYVALMNAKSTDTLGPQYRCAIYESNLSTGDITLKFSNDSTCSHINRSGTDQRRVIQKKEATRREMLVLHPMPVKSWPDVNFCRLPSWMHGEWQHLTIRPDRIVYKDHTSFKTYTMKCMKNPIPDRYLVLSRSQW